MAQTPAGDIVDRTKYKREILGFAAVVVALTSMSVPVLSEFHWVAVTRAFQGIACAAVAPAISALTLGIVGPDGFTDQVGSNET